MVCSARGWKKGISVFLRWTDLKIVSVDMVIIALPLAPNTRGRRKRSKIEFNLWLQTNLFQWEADTNSSSRESHICMSLNNKIWARQRLNLWEFGRTVILMFTKKIYQNTFCLWGCRENCCWVGALSLWGDFSIVGSLGNKFFLIFWSELHAYWTWIHMRCLQPDSSGRSLNQTKCRWYGYGIGMHEFLSPKHSYIRCFVACIVTFFCPNRSIYFFVESILLVLQFFSLGEGVSWVPAIIFEFFRPVGKIWMWCGSWSAVVESATVMCQNF